MELYGRVVHDDWLRFLDEEILDVLPEQFTELLATLAIAERPVPWPILAAAAGVEGKPPAALLERGLILDLEAGLWLHEAIRDRLLREVGSDQEARRDRLKKALKE